jgi:IS5 family transposase
MAARPSHLTADGIGDTADLVIGHLKNDHRMGRNRLKGRDGDRINAVLGSAASYDLSLLRRWFEQIPRAG